MNKYLFQFKIFVFYILPLFLIISCNRSKPEKREDPILKSYRLIDEQRSEEAIILLESELVNNPNSVKLRSVLASAYAHKAGIKLQKFVPLLYQIRQNLKNKTKLSELKLFTNQSISKSTLVLSNLFLKLSSIFEIYNAIPNISTLDSVYLKYAIHLLKTMPSEIPKEDLIYRGILEVILFKHLISENLIGDLKDQVSIDDSNCIIDFVKIKENFLTLGKLLIEIQYDLKLTDSKQIEELVQSLKDFSESASEFSLINMDESSKNAMKQNLHQFGFGKVIQCE